MSEVKQSSVYRLAVNLKVIISEVVISRINAQIAFNGSIGTISNYNTQDILMAVAVRYVEQQKSKGKGFRFSSKCAVAYITQLIEHSIEEFNNPKIDPQFIQWQKIADCFGEKWIAPYYNQATAIGLEHSWK